MKNFDRETEIFIREYAQATLSGDASVFIGAGLSQDAGYKGWAELLKDKASDIGLDVEKERNDLISLAQYYINKKQRTQINNAIRSFFAANDDIIPTKTHQILSALPIKSYWTTNYDRLLEQTFEQRKITCRAYFSDEDLSVTTDNAQVIIHKMHGDVEHPISAVIAKEDYEKYDETHEMMLAKFKGEMCSKTFLFLGYSFSDPNIHHILARIRKVYDKNAKQHYCIMKKVPKKENGKKTKDYEYKAVKQEHQIADFKNYGVNVILVDDYSDIVKIFEEIRRRVYMKNVLICGAYEDSTLNKEYIEKFTTTITTWLIERGCRIFSGFGKNLGGYVVKGAFDGCTLGSGKNFNTHVNLFPFPYNVNLSKSDRQELYTRLRENMIINTKITLIICGEKIDDKGELIPSPGVLEEFKISKEQGNLIIPISVSGGAAKLIWENMKSENTIEYTQVEFNNLNAVWDNYDTILNTVQDIICDYID